MTNTQEALESKNGVNFRMYTTSPAGLVSNAVLVEGDREAILIDTSLVIADGKELIERVKSTGKRLNSILITHAHPDHYATIALFKEAFPETQVLARQGVIDGIMEWPAKQLHWQDAYGDTIPFEVPLPELLVGDHIDLEGRVLQIVDLPPAETIHATAFYLPEQKALIAGDAAFESTHLYMADTNNPASWLATLEFVRRLGKIELVFPGHGKFGGAEILDMTAAWLDYYAQVAKPGVRFPDIASAMLAKFPDYALPIVLWLTRGPAFGLAGPQAAGVPPEYMP